MTDTVLRLVIRGRVQGVGFRWAMTEQAVQFGVTGWVRNRRDGSVEAMVAGSAPAVERVVEWARRGPPLAVVAGVDLEPGDGVFASFDQRPTA